MGMAAPPAHVRYDMCLNLDVEVDVVSRPCSRASRAGSRTAHVPLLAAAHDHTLRSTRAYGTVCSLGVRTYGA